MPAAESQPLLLAAAPAADIGGLAVAVGRLLEKQDSMNSTIGRVEDKLDGLVAKVDQHGVKIGVQDERLNGIERSMTERMTNFQGILDGMKPVRAHWSAVAAVIVGLLATIISVVSTFKL